ncbi:hypothetical protein [Nocardia asteroides]|uniref:hypothetical protein n=1 Tax=Nocardia asteroides TaxID=1824 RepID=UPI001E43E7F8|nr:hypothetical protein [Nocardia asteroides]UGT59266.1 hypothetical protein LTT61_18470 [Nocardia asteroides]
MATFDPRSWSVPPLWSPLRAMDVGKKLLDQSWATQWVAATTAWVDPVADLGAGTVTALLPDVLMTLLSEGILSRFGGRAIDATVLGHELHATLEVLEVRRMGAHFQTKTVLAGLRWDGHPIETVTVIAHGVRLVPGVPTRLRAARVEVAGTVTTAALLEWLGTRQLEWSLAAEPDGRIRATHRRRRITAWVDAEIRDGALTIEVHKARWSGLPVPRRMLGTSTVPLAELPFDARVTRGTRDGDLVRFQAEVPAVSASFDLAEMRSAIVTGTALILF